MSFEYDIQSEPIVFHKALIDKLLQDEKPMEVFSLYAFYCHTTKQQQTNQVRSTTADTAKELKCSQDKIRAIKKRLIKYGLIEDVKTKNEHNKVTGHHIKINFV